MGEEIELVSDGDGLAVIGKAGDVERFMGEQGLTARPLGLARLTSVAGRASALAQAGSAIAENSGRWVKLTRESAEAVRKFGLTPTKTPGVSHAMIGKPGDIQQWIQIVKAPGALLTNPASLAGAAGMMSQLAMQQAMDEITSMSSTRRTRFGFSWASSTPSGTAIDPTGESVSSSRNGSSSSMWKQTAPATPQAALPTSTCARLTTMSRS